jgi:hypothetical protein
MFPNRNSLLSALALVALLPGAAPATAAPPAFAYQATTLEKAAPAGRAGGNASESRVIAVDLALLAGDPDKLQVELPDGRSFVAYRTLSWTEEGDRRNWNGEIRDEGSRQGLPEGYVTLAVEGELVAGAVSIGAETFGILPLGQGKQSLTRAAAATGPAGKGSTCKVLPVPLEAEIRHSAGLLEKDGSSKDGKGSAPQAVIDVLAIYPESLATPARIAQTQAQINAHFCAANQVLANSQANAIFRLVYSAKLYGEQPPVAANSSQNSPELGINWLRAGQPQVASLASAVGADFVALFVPGDDNTVCGAAEIGHVTTNEYAVIDIDCSVHEYILAHELGHLLGMRHPADEYGSSPIPPAPYPFAFGFDNNNQLLFNGHPAASVVACNGDVNGVPNNTLTGIQCNRRPCFSSPTIQACGVTIGSASANNAEVARLIAPAAAARRPTASFGNLPPRVDILRPVGDYVQKHQMLTLSAYAFDYEDGEKEGSSIQWSSDLRGPLGSGKLLRVLSTLDGFETITATVTDSAGLTGSRSKTVINLPAVDTVGAIWHDPSFPDRYLSFNKNEYHQWVATWMAYEGDDPVWYQSDVVPVYGINGSFSAQLHRYTRDPWTGVQTGTPVGTLSIAVETERQIRLQISSGPAGPVDLMLEPYTSANGPGSYWSLIPQGWPPEYVVDGGWMIWRGPKVGGANNEEVRILITFDGSGPVWLIGSGTQQFGPGNSLFATDMHRLSLGSGSHNAGGLAFFTNNSNGSVSLLFQSGNTWIRTNQLMAPATVR